MKNLRTLWTEKIKFQLGALIDLVTYALFWFGLINFVFIGLTAYNTTLKDWVQTVIPGFNLLWFLVTLLTVAIVIMIAERFILYPARQHFRNKWEYSNESPIRQDLSQVLRNQQKLLGLTGSRVISKEKYQKLLDTLHYHVYGDVGKAVGDISLVECLDEVLQELNIKEEKN